VRRRLAETGWTLTIVADRAGLSVATISAIKNGTRGKRPRRTTVVRLAHGLELSEEDLLLVSSFRESGRDRPRPG
jgi:transcriptional regulator with XRE-family HTH domain